MRSFKRIALFVPRGTAFGRATISGIGRYCVRQRRDWLFTVNSVLSPARINAAGRYFDGIVAATTSRAMAAALDKCPRPCVNVSAAPAEQLPTVRSDFRAAGAAGARYLITRVFTQLAFYGSPFGNASRMLDAGFSRLARQAGITCRIF